MARRPGPKLADDQRDQLLTWLAAGYGYTYIAAAFADRSWPSLSRQALTYYRQRFGVKIAALQETRHRAALTTGLALKEERIARLKEDAEWLEAHLHIPGKSGKLYNEAAWRETLRQIAEELGQWVQKAEVSGPGGAPLFGAADVAAALGQLTQARVGRDAGD